MSPQGSNASIIPYADPAYWEQRYSRSGYEFEWFVGYTALRRVLRTYVPKKKLCLHVGCGASNLQEGMAKAGYSVVNTDISSELIQQLKIKHACYPNLSYCVSDCRCMPEFKACHFGSVIDKGTVDALLCCKTAQENIDRMFGEVARVLQPGGVFLLVTLGAPPRRLPMLCQPQYKWQVSVLLIPKLQPQDQATVNGSPINDSTSPVEVDGPYEVVDGNIVGWPPGIDPNKFFYAYVCKKDPLQLTSGSGQRLPPDWVSGSREVFEQLQQKLNLPPDLLKKGKRTRKLSLREFADGRLFTGQEMQWSQLAARLPRPQSAPSMQQLEAQSAVQASSSGIDRCMSSSIYLQAGSSHACPMSPQQLGGPGSPEEAVPTVAPCTAEGLLSLQGASQSTVQVERRPRRPSYASLVAAMTSMDGAREACSSSSISHRSSSSSSHSHSQDREDLAAGTGSGRLPFLGSSPSSPTAAPDPSSPRIMATPVLAPASDVLALSGSVSALGLQHQPPAAAPPLRIAGAAEAGLPALAAGQDGSIDSSGGGHHSWLAGDGSAGMGGQKPPLPLQQQQVQQQQQLGPCFQPGSPVAQSLHPQQPAATVK